MKQRVFLKSTLRQPVRTVFLLLLIGVISFAFATRAGEYLLIRQEVAEAGSYYRSIGTLEALREDVDYHAVTEYLEENERVDVVNKRRAITGLIQDGFPNADVDGLNYLPNYEPEMIGDLIDCNPYDIVFYGTYSFSTYMQDGDVTSDYRRFTVDEVVVGRPEHITEGKDIIVVYSDTGTGDEGEQLQEGERYLIRAAYDYLDPRTWDAYDRDSFQYFIQKSLWHDGPWSIEAPGDLDLEQPQYARFAQEIQVVRENQYSLSMTTYEDLSAYAYLLEDNMYLVDGRWFTAEDNASGKPMCVLNQGFAASRGLEVGDTLTLKLRNIGHYNGYVGDPDWSVDMEDYLSDEIPVETVTFEIVGISALTYPYQSDFSLWNYCTSNAVPDEFVYTYPTEDTASNFVINDPEEEDAFLVETEEDLLALGFRVVFAETGWDNFKATTDAMTGAALGNVLIFGVVLLACLLLASFLYFRFRWRDVAISRALGVPAGKCVGSAALPLILVGGIGTVAGCALAWAYVDANAASLLSALTELSGGESGEAAAEAAALPIPWLVLLMAGLIVLLVVLALIFSAATARKSPLALLQGGSNRKK